MSEPKISLTPERFGEEYLKALFNFGQQSGALESYKGKDSWTKRNEEIAEKVISNVYINHKDIHPMWMVQKEYYKIDFIGYLTNWDSPNNTEKQHDWELKIAYEHENECDKWHDELCKLCYIVADLRVLVSYHDFEKGPAENILQQKINRLGIWRLHRVPNCNWLFLFGPSQHYGYPFKAFTLDSDLKVIELECCKNIQVIPMHWK